jgi:hypothetical protein
MNKQSLNVLLRCSNRWRLKKVTIIIRHTYRWQQCLNMRQNVLWTGDVWTVDVYSWGCLIVWHARARLNSRLSRQNILTSKHALVAPPTQGLSQLCETCGLRPTTWSEQVTRYRSGCYEILAPNKWHWTSDISACGKTCHSDLRLLGDNELRMGTLPAQPRSSQAAMTVKQEFKQTLTRRHTHTHMWSLTASMTGVYKLNDMNIEQVTCYMAATSWPLNLEVVEFQRRPVKNQHTQCPILVKIVTATVSITL